FITVGHLTTWPVILFACGFVLMIALDHNRVPGAVMIGVILVAVVGMALGISPAPKGVVSVPPSLAPTFLQLDLSGLFGLAVHTLLFVVFAFLLVDVFDNAGTLIGLAHHAGLLDERGHLPGLGRALIADSSAASIGALLGTSTTT